MELHPEAFKYFEDTKTHKDIKDFVSSRAREHTYLDFKLIPYRDMDKEEKGELDTNKLKELLSIAAGGYAHQKGGVIIWGIVAKQSGVGDFADGYEPIEEIEAVLESLRRFSKDAIVPRLPIEHEAIYINDDKASNKGFIKSYFPMSREVHVSAYSSRNFYQRVGDSFHSVTTKEQLQSLLNRGSEPELKLRATSVVTSYRTDVDGQKHIRTRTFHLYFVNTGSGLAEYPSVQIESIPKPRKAYDPSGNSSFSKGDFVDNIHDGTTQYIPAAGFVVYPSQEVSIGILKYEGETLPIIKYKCFAKGMIPQEGEVHVVEDEE